MDVDAWKSESQTLRATLRHFVQEKIQPHAQTWDLQEQVPKTIFAELAQLGLFGLKAPSPLGGAGLGAQAATMVLEELARGDGGLALMLASHNALVLAHLLHSGNLEQQERYVSDLASGKLLGAWALTETSSGSDMANLQTSALQEGDQWRLQGSKRFVTLGSLADVLVIFARTDKAKGDKGITAFLVPATTEGVTSSSMQHKLGMRSADIAQIHLENVLIPDSHRLGAIHAGLSDALPILDQGRLAVAAIALGLGIAALQAARSHVCQRQQFQQKLVTIPVVGNRLADMAMQLAAAREMVQVAAALAEQEQPYSKQAAMAKLLATQAACYAAQQAVYLYGGEAMGSEQPVARIWRDAQLCTIAGGSSDMQRLLIRNQLFGEGRPS